MHLVLCPVSVPEDPRHVVVQKLALVVEGRPDVELDLTGVKNKRGSRMFFTHTIQLSVDISHLRHKYCCPL